MADQTTVAAATTSSALQLEKCLFGREVVQLPVALIEDSSIFAEVVSIQTWQRVLTDAQRRRLLKMLPDFPQNDVLEKQQTLRALFGGQNFKFGSPLRQFHSKVKEGMFSPDVARYTLLCRKAKHREYNYQQQTYYSTLLKEILINRQKILESFYKTPIDEPLQLEDIRYKAPSGEKSLQQKVKRRYYKILQEVNKEAGVEGTSSDEEEAQYNASRVQRQIFHSPNEATEVVPPSVLSTFAPAPSPTLVNGQSGESAPQPASTKRSLSPVEITDDDFQEMLRKHKRRRAEGEEHPELETRNLTLQDVILRTQPSRKLDKHGLAGIPGIPPMNTTRKKGREKGERRRKKGGGKEEGSPEEILTQLGSMAVPGLPEDESAQDGMDVVSEFASHSATSDTNPGMNSPRQNFGLQGSFFALLRNLITEETEAKITTGKLEEKVREWQGSVGAGLNTWYNQEASWPDQVLSALKFLSGDVLVLSMENFVPFLDYKERAQQWKWIGAGRDSDDALLPFFLHWLENKDSLISETAESGSASPPPPRIRSTYIVRPTTDEEKAIFQQQERNRYDNPHQAFTFCLHGYESVVGPVKGVYTKDTAMNKAREHSLLIKERPSYVTILNLVRDAAARLPNGEGTRGDICELLKDSQFLAPAVTDAQLNTVVSGALDRLHYEKDPCVKYEVNKKLWVYLHRNRTEEEFERIHQAQGAAAKAKKALQKPKPAKKIKETVQAVAAAVASITHNMPTPQFPSATATLTQQASILKTESPLATETAGIVVSPRTPQAVQSPRTPQMTPSPGASPVKQTQSSPRLISSPVASGNTKVVGIAQLAQQAQAGSPRPVMVTPSKPGAVITGKPAVVAGKPSVTGMPAVLAGKPSVTGMTSMVGGKPAMIGGKPAIMSGKPGMVGVNPGIGVGATLSTAVSQGKPVAVRFLQPQSIAKASTSNTTAAVSMTTPVLSGSKPVAFSLLHPHPAGGTAVGRIEVSSGGGSQNQPRALLLTSKPDGQKVVLTPQSVAGNGNQPRQAVASPRSSTPGTPPTNKPMMARIVQQLPSQQQVVSVANLVGSSVTTAKPATLQGATTIKIQGGSILQPQGGKPMTLQRVQSVDPATVVSADAKSTKMSLHRTHSADNLQAHHMSAQSVESILSSIANKTALSTHQVSVGGGKPSKVVVATQGSTIKHSVPLGGKPSTLTTQATAKPAAAVADIAHLVQSASIAGQPIIIGGKPAVISGKPIHIGGKPIQLVQGKPGQIGLLQGQAGLVSALNIIPQTSSVVTTSASAPRIITQSGTAASAPTLVSQILQAGGATVLQHQARPAGGGGAAATMGRAQVLAAGQQRILGPAQGGLMVTQLPQGTTVTRPGTVRQALLTSQSGKPSNIQVVKTVLSQPGGKPAQTTIVLAPPTNQPVQGTVVSADHLSQAGVKAIPAVTKGKGGPVYARIITPPPGIRLAAVRPGQVTLATSAVTTMPGVSVIQTALGKLPGDLTGAQVVAVTPATTTTPAVTKQPSTDSK